MCKLAKVKFHKHNLSVTEYNLTLNVNVIHATIKKVVFQIQLNYEFSLDIMKLITFKLSGKLPALLNLLSFSFKVYWKFLLSFFLHNDRINREKQGLVI